LLGALDYAKLNSNLRKMSLETGMFGMTLAEIRTAESDYLELLRNQGQLRELDTDDMTKGFTQLISINQTIAGILGKTRDEALKAAAEQSRDANTTMAMRASGMNAEQMNAANTLLGNIKGESEGYHAMLTDFIQKGGLVSEKATQFAALAPELQELARQQAAEIEAGRISGEAGQRRIMGELQAALRPMMQDQSRMEMYGALSTLMGNDAMTDFNRLAVAVESWDPTVKPNPGDTSDGATGAVLGTQEVFERLKISISSLVDRFLLPFLTDHGDDLMKAIIGMSEGIVKLNNFFLGLDPKAALMTVVGGFVAFLGVKGILWKKMIEMVSSLGRNLLGIRSPEAPVSGRRPRSIVGGLANGAPAQSRGWFGGLFNRAPNVSRNARMAREMAKTMDEAGKVMSGRSNVLLNTIRGLSTNLQPITNAFTSGSRTLQGVTAGTRPFFSFLPKIGGFVTSLGGGLKALGPLARMFGVFGKFLGPIGIALSVGFDALKGLFMTKGNIFQRLVGAITNMISGAIIGLLDFTRVIARLISRGLFAGARFLGFKGWADRREAEMEVEDREAAAEYRQGIEGFLGGVEQFTGIDDNESALQTRRDRAAAANPPAPATPEPARPARDPLRVEVVEAEPDFTPVDMVGGEDETSTVREWDGNGFEPAIDRMRRAAEATPARPEPARLASEVRVDRRTANEAGNPGYTPVAPVRQPEPARVVSAEETALARQTAEAARENAEAARQRVEARRLETSRTDQPRTAMSAEQFTQLTSAWDPMSRLMANMGRNTMHAMGSDFATDGSVIARDNTTTVVDPEAKAIENQILQNDLLRKIYDQMQNQSEMFRADLATSQAYYQNALRLQEEANRRIRESSQNV
jgi:hypothetical protein